MFLNTLLSETLNHYFLLFSRSASVGDHVLFWLYVRPGQLLCLHDLLPCVCLPGPGGKEDANHLGGSSLGCARLIRFLLLLNLYSTRENPLRWKIYFSRLTWTRQATKYETHSYKQQIQNKTSQKMNQSSNIDSWTLAIGRYRVQIRTRILFYSSLCGKDWDTSFMLWQHQAWLKHYCPNFVTNVYITRMGTR